MCRLSFEFGCGSESPNGTTTCRRMLPRAPSHSHAHPLTPMPTLSLPTHRNIVRVVTLFHKWDSNGDGGAWRDRARRDVA